MKIIDGDDDISSHYEYRLTWMDVQVRHDCIWIGFVCGSLAEYFLLVYVCLFFYLYLVSLVDGVCLFETLLHVAAKVVVTCVTAIVIAFQFMHTMRCYGCRWPHTTNITYWQCSQGSQYKMYLTHSLLIHHSSIDFSYVHYKYSKFYFLYLFRNDADKNMNPIQFWLLKTQFGIRFK